MHTDSIVKSSVSFLVLFALVAGIFILDTRVSLEVAIGILYLLPILLTVFHRAIYSTAIIAVLSCTLIILGIFLSPEGGESWKIFINRSVSILSIIVAAVLIHYIKVITLKNYGDIEKSFWLLLKYVRNIVAPTIVILLAVFIVFSGLRLVKERIIERNVEVLKVIVHSVHSTLHDTWLSRIVVNLDHRSMDPLVINSIEVLLKSDKTVSSLISNPALVQLRDYFGEYLRDYEARGIFVITPDGFNLASMRDNNLAQTNFIYQYYPERMERVFQGQWQFIPPIPSDVPLLDKKGLLVEHYPTMFIVVPIRDAQRNTIAALSVRLDPLDTFSRITKSFEVGTSGEAYLFDEKARIVTKTRLGNQSKYIDVSNFELFSTTNGKKGGTTTDMFDQAVKGGVGHSMKAYLDYRGVRVFGAWLWDSSMDLGFVAEIDESELLEEYRYIQRTVFWVFIAIMLLAVSFYYSLMRFTRGIDRRLEASEARLSATLDGVVDGIISINKKGVILGVNPAGQDLFGYS